ncbi:6-phosphofructokinase, partial [Candidatus Margulisiibacteriota bacterium]
MATKTINEQALEQKLIRMEKQSSPLEQNLKKQEIPAVSVFKDGTGYKLASFSESKMVLTPKNETKIRHSLPKLFRDIDDVVLQASPTQRTVTGKRVAVLFSGGPAAGGHNVVVGIKKILGRDNTLYGVQNGPKGLVAGDLIELANEHLDRVVNLGGFDLLGSDRTKIKTKEQYENVKKTVKAYKLDGIIIIGGDDSNTNAAFLAEYLYDEGCKVIGVPKTIDGDL